MECMQSEELEEFISSYKLGNFLRLEEFYLFQGWGRISSLWQPWKMLGILPCSDEVTYLFVQRMRDWTAWCYLEKGEAEFTCCWDNTCQKSLGGYQTPGQCQRKNGKFCRLKLYRVISLVYRGAGEKLLFPALARGLAGKR